MLFSQRIGKKPFRSMIQKEEMDQDLRNGLWNVLDLCVWHKNHQEELRYSSLDELFLKYWGNFFKSPLDTRPYKFYDALLIIREYFFKKGWDDVYDFVEFTAQMLPEIWRDDFIKYSNHVLEREMSAYRFVGDTLVEITAEGEISSIEEALGGSRKLEGVHEHLETAMQFLSDRKSPDYRNSIKESISAVESLAQILTRQPKATLGQALKMLEEKGIPLHPALKNSFLNLYGYTSDEKGIRHALMEESNLKFHDAKYMLVSCTAFVNYLLAKAAEEGIELS